MGKAEGGRATGWDMWNAWFLRLIFNSDSVISMLRSNHMFWFGRVYAYDIGRHRKGQTQSQRLA